MRRLLSRPCLALLLLLAVLPAAAQQPDSSGALLPGAKATPGQPIVFTATEDIPPPYKVTATLAGDTIKFFVNDVLVRWMKSPSPRIDKVMEANEQAIARTIEKGAVQVFLPRGDLLFSPLCAQEVQTELHHARNGDANYNYQYLRHHHVKAIAAAAKQEKRKR